MTTEQDRGSTYFGIGVVVAGAVVIAATVWMTQDHKVDVHAGVAIPPPTQQASAAAAGSGPAGRPTEPQWLTEQRVAAELALEKNPNDLDALNVLTQVHLPEPASAMAYNQRAIEVAPDDPDARTLQAVLSSIVGMHDKALAEIDAVLMMHPDHPRALTYKGIVSLEAGRYDDAEAALRKVLDLVGHDPGVAAALAEARRRRTEGADGPGHAPGGGHSAGDYPQQEQGPDHPTRKVVFGGTIDLAPGKAGLPGEAIYVSLRPVGGGPPLAALRLPPGPFPLKFTVTPSDAISMGAAPPKIPQTFDVVVRWDTDGDAMTKLPSEPEALVRGATFGTSGAAVILK